MTYYDILHISPQASADHIRAAYRTLAKRYHPDANPLNRNVAAAQFRIIQDAYDHLREPSRRAAYDQTLRARTWTSTHAGNDNDVSDLFTSARRTLERLMRLMVSTRTVPVKGEGHHG